MSKWDTRSEKLGTEVTLELDGKKVKFPSKSTAIKELNDRGMKVGDIAKLLGIRYQFAYNVIQRKNKR